MHIKAITVYCMFFVNVLFCQNHISKSDSTIFQKEAVFIKVWGFLKYYHPNVANGKYNWDEQFLVHLPLIQKAKNKEEITVIYLNWIDSLGKVKKSNIPEFKNESEYFTKNLDLTWLENKDYFASVVAEKLKFIRDNRYQGKPFYVKKDRTGNVLMINEIEYQKESYPDTAMRILSLSRFWNTVEYFFPYKYQTDQNWDDVLLEMTGKFVSAKNEQEYHLVMLETAVKTDDGHAVFKTHSTVNFFGPFFFPAEIKIVAGKAIITNLPNDSLAKVNDLKVGDIIEKVNGEDVSAIIDNKLKYLSGSNINGKLRPTYMYLANGIEKTVAIVLSRNLNRLHKSISRYPYDSIYNKEIEKVKYKVVEDNIGYINMAHLEMKDVDQMMEQFQNLKGLIIDIRNYPNFLPYVLAGRLVKENKEFATIMKPDFSYPGRFQYQKMGEISSMKKYFKGKVVLLVDENTQSMAEFSTMILQAGDHVTTMGSQTAGADGNASYISFLKERSMLSGTGVFYPDGTETQRKGVKVDIKVKPTIKGVQSGIDEILAKAIELIKAN